MYWLRKKKNVILIVDLLWILKKIVKSIVILINKQAHTVSIHLFIRNNQAVAFVSHYCFYLFQLTNNVYHSYRNSVMSLFYHLFFRLEKLKKLKESSNEKNQLEKFPKMKMDNFLKDEFLNIVFTFIYQMDKDKYKKLQ